jgi:2-methylisocitrate lyase-like PEP mutase family enzyme
VAGVMVEDTDCSSVKHLWRDEAGGRDFSDETLYPLDVALDRLAVALESRRSGDDLLVLARTDMWHQNTPDSRDQALERARLYADAGADFVLITGMKGVDVTADAVASIGAPIIHAEDEGVSSDERRRLAAAGVKVLYHWLVPFTAAFAGYKSALQGLRTDSLVMDRSPSEINDELLRTVDLPGWSKVARRIHPDQ